MDNVKNDEYYLKKDRETKYREHFKHMCESGYDPLLCLNRKTRIISYSGNHGGMDAQSAKMHIDTRDMTQFIDRIITEERYADLLEQAKTPSSKLDDIISIPLNLVCVAGPTTPYIGGSAAIFWLYPSGCRNLGDLYKKYEKKIKNELRSMIITY